MAMLCIVTSRLSRVGSTIASRDVEVAQALCCFGSSKMLCCFGLWVQLQIPTLSLRALAASQSRFGVGAIVSSRGSLLPWRMLNHVDMKLGQGRRRCVGKVN